jgi:hypothetical protein
VGGGGGSGSPVAHACPAGEFAVGFMNGELLCSSIDQAVKDAINTHCSVYLGSRDSCGGCVDPPTKWGFAGGNECADGAGTNNTCSKQSLGGQEVTLFGLNTDGDVNDDDKLYLGFHCLEGSSVVTPGPCGQGEVMAGLVDGGVMCVPASGSVVDAIRNHCSLYFGWTDDCDGCTAAPAKWGRVGPIDCSSGVGAGNACLTANLGGQSVELLGLSMGGDVDDNDKLYLGARCEPPAPAMETVMGLCPPGQLVTGIEANGSVTCASPAPHAGGVFKDQCAFYFGWSDSCNGCMTAPAKWGKATEGACMNGFGGDSTCQTATLGTAPVELFGLNPDGDVNDDDTFYVGSLCD